MKSPFWRSILTLAVVAGLGAAAFATREHWQPWLATEKPSELSPDFAPANIASDRVVLTDQTVSNLGIVAQPLKPTTYWKKITVPGMIVDRPGHSDHSVVAPGTGVVQAIERVPGETVRPGETLFTLKLLSESLHETQTELFKATQDAKLSQSQRSRLAASGNVVPEARLIEVDSQIARFETAARAYRQELTTRGFSSEQIAGVADGKFVNEITIAVPSHAARRPSHAASRAPDLFFEIQELKVDLGQQVQAGQALCVLSNHQSLAIEGRAFRDETPFLERAVKEGWPVEVDFQEPAGSDWKATNASFPIEQLGSTIDPVHRTFSFLLPLENELRTVERNGRSQRLWRYRPGQKVRLYVPVEKLENVFVLPVAAVTFDGAEAFTFSQNVNTFVRKPVRVLVRDRQSVVVANDGAIVAGAYAVQGAAAQLNRMVKSQSSTVPKGYHIHADGSLHKNGEPD